MTEEPFTILVIYLNEVHAQYKSRLSPFRLRNAQAKIILADQGFDQLRGHWFDLVMWSDHARRGITTSQRQAWDRFLPTRLRRDGLIWEL